MNYCLSRAFSLAALAALLAVVSRTPALADTTSTFVAPGNENLTPAEIHRLAEWQRGFLRNYFRNPRSVTQSQMLAYKRTLNWMHLSSNGPEKYMSAESLLLSSALVAEVRVNNVIATIPHGAEIHVIYDIVPTIIFRHFLGPAANVKVGDHLLFSDEALNIGAEYADDQLVRAHTNPVLFLKLASASIAKYSRRPIYVTTAPFVSKWTTDSHAQLHVMSARHSAIAASVTGETAISLALRVNATYGAGALASERSFLIALLARRGIRSPNQIATYAAALGNEKTQMAISKLFYDADRAAAASRAAH